MPLRAQRRSSRLSARCPQRRRPLLSILGLWDRRFEVPPRLRPSSTAAARHDEVAMAQPRQAALVVAAEARPVISLAELQRQLLPKI